MSTFSILLNTSLFSSTYLQASVSDGEGALQQELSTVIGNQQNGTLKNTSTSIRFTMEPDHKLVILDVIGSEGLDVQQISKSLSGYQVQSRGAEPYVVYHMDIPAC